MQKYIKFLICSFFLTTQLAFSATLENKIQGLENPLLSNAITRLKIQQQGVTLTPATIKQLHREAPEQIKKALEPFGYFKARVISQLTQINDDQWLANYTVIPGPILIISTLDITITGDGKNAKEFRELLANCPLKKGSPLLTQEYNNTKQALFNMAERLGYLDAQLTQHVIRINLDAYTARIILHFDTGHRYYFGAVRFTQNPLSNDFLQRFVHFKKGQAYSGDDIIVLQKNLNNSGFFQQAIVKPEQKKAANYHVPLKVTVIPRKAQQYSFGVGYGTDTGPRTSIGWDWRYLTASGHHLSSLLRLSPVQNTAQMVYVIPGTNPLTGQYNINASVLRNQWPLGNNILSKLGAASITTLGGWTQTIALNYQRERYRFLDQSDYNNSTLLLPGITWQRTLSDDPLHPRNGYRASLNIQGASQSFMSDTSLIQTTASGKYIHPLGAKGRILLRSDLGYTVVHNRSYELPLSLSYFAGGARSVRGYSYQALGPGRYLVVGSVEYQHEIIKNWNAAIFFDAGNAFQNMPQTEHLFNALQQGLGIGAVWISPIGPINLSVAKAINAPGRPMQIQFSMGPDL